MLILAGDVAHVQRLVRPLQELLDVALEQDTVEAFGAGRRGLRCHRELIVLVDGDDSLVLRHRKAQVVVAHLRVAVALFGAAVERSSAHFGRACRPVLLLLLAAHLLVDWGARRVLG